MTSFDNINKIQCLLIFTGYWIFVRLNPSNNNLQNIYIHNTYLAADTYIQRRFFLCMTAYSTHTHMLSAMLVAYCCFVVDLFVQFFGFVVAFVFILRSHWFFAFLHHSQNICAWASTATKNAILTAKVVVELVAVVARITKKKSARRI